MRKDVKTARLEKQLSEAKKQIKEAKAEAIENILDNPS